MVWVTLGEAKPRGIEGTMPELEVDYWTQAPSEGLALPRRRSHGGFNSNIFDPTASAR